MLELRQEVIRRRLLATGRGVVDVARDWPVEDAPHRTTLYRWLQSQTLPRSQRHLLGLAGALDVDPFALWAVTAPTFERVVARVTRVLWSKEWARIHPALSFLEFFVGPLAEWPVERIAQEYFHRSWKCREFKHDASSSTQAHYVQVVLQPAESDAFWDPHVFHFAWRDSRAPTTGWRPYGFVEVSRSDAQVRLFHFSGWTQSVGLKADVVAVVVETFFGPRSAAFRVASLHEFRLHIPSAPPSDIPRVRFE